MQAILLYCFATQQQTSMKSGLLYVKFNAEFNELSLFFLKATRSGQKMTKTKVVRKNANWRQSGAKG